MPERSHDLSTEETAAVAYLDPVVFGHRLRHLRRQRGLTLAALGARVGRKAPYLSKVEHGHIEPTLSMIGRLAGALGVPVDELLTDRAPNHRARLEIELQRAQADPLYAELGLEPLRITAAVPDVVLDHLVRLFTEVRRRAEIRARTPEEARQGNAALRAEMRRRDNHFPEIEALAADVLGAVGHTGGGPLTRRDVDELAVHLGFRVVAVPDLPSSTRSLTDLRNRRIYVPVHGGPGNLATRSVVAQTLGHFVLGHADPQDFGGFLRQRVEANYFAGAVLVPQDGAVDLLATAKQVRDLSVEDLAEAFNVSYEMAAHRFTNLATRHLDIPTHFVRSDQEGIIWKAYENNGVPFPRDPDGAIEGQRLCRRWGTRRVFADPAGHPTHAQFTDTPAGTFWCTTHLDAAREPHHAVTVGTRFADALYFRGRDTAHRVTSGCPDPACCRRPPVPLAERWDSHAWPSPRPHSHVLAALPVGSFPGVDLTEAYTFLERHDPAGTGDAPPPDAILRA